MDAARQCADQSLHCRGGFLQIKHRHSSQNFLHAYDAPTDRNVQVGQFSLVCGCGSTSNLPWTLEHRASVCKTTERPRAASRFRSRRPQSNILSPLTTLPFFGVWWSFFDVRARWARPCLVSSGSRARGCRAPSRHPTVAACSDLLPSGRRAAHSLSDDSASDSSSSEDEYDSRSRSSSEWA